MIKRILSHPVIQTHFHQLWKFGVTGGIAALLDIATSTALHEFLNLPVPVAYICSSGVAVIFMFVMNKYFTFANHEHDTGKQLQKFVLVYGGAIILNFAISTSLFSIGVQYILAKTIAIGIGAVLNYLLSHHFVFKKKEEEEPIAIV